MGFRTEEVGLKGIMMFVVYLIYFFNLQDVREEV